MIKIEKGVMPNKPHNKWDEIRQAVSKMAPDESFVIPIDNIHGDYKKDCSVARAKLQACVERPLKIKLTTQSNKIDYTVRVWVK